MAHYVLGALLLLELSSFVVETRQLVGDSLNLMPEMSEFLHNNTGPSGNNDGFSGIRWAVLVAGSRGYENYRHQVIGVIILYL